MRPRMRDDGNLMLLSGIVVTIAFVTTALTLSQVSMLERQAVADATTSLAAEWRFIRERLAGSITTSVTPDLKNETFRTVTLPSIVATYRSVQAEKGFDIVIRPATTLTTFNKTEQSILDPPIFGATYNAWSYDGALKVDWDVDPDPRDGIIWKAPCRAPEAPDTGCIQAVMLSVQMTNGEATVHEVLLVPTNLG